MAISVDPDQTAPIGAVCSGSTLFAFILNSSVMLGNYLQQTTSADDFSRRHFQMHFFLCALRVKYAYYHVTCTCLEIFYSTIYIALEFGIISVTMKANYNYLNNFN